MGYLWTLVQAYLDSQGGMSARALARKIDVRAQTVDSWKNRGSTPSPANLRDLSEGIGVDYEVLLAAVETDAGYRTPEDLLAGMAGSRIKPEVLERLRQHVAPSVTKSRNAGRRKTS